VSEPLSKRLEKHFANIILRLIKLFEDLGVRYCKISYPGVAVVFPDYCWNKCTPEQERERIELQRDYEGFYDILKLLFAKAPEDLRRKLEYADKHFRTWLELQSNWSLHDDMAQNLSDFNNAAKDILDLMAIFSSAPEGETIIVPDTNSLLKCNDPVSYRAAINQGTFTFILLPTVLCELDNLKILHRNPEVREKAEKAITRIKGWKNQGPLSKGVKVDNTIKVKTEHKEPDMENTLPWLDKTVSDDRIIASVLQIQAENATCAVHLITNDINLLNKAEAAFVSAIDF
jgi:hypothetical protein